MADLSLTVRDLSLRSNAAPLSTRISGGEIVGLAGLDGHGQDVFLRSLAGLERNRGAVDLQGNRIATFRDAERNAVVYVPRDRRSTGIFPGMSILDNFAIATPGRDRRGPLISDKARRARYETWKERLQIKAPSPEAPITALSGGNQQKVLLLNDPTRGVDVATRLVLYDLFRDLAAEGMALVILSSEIEEILVLCNRVLVFRDHALAAEMAGEAMGTEAVIAAMFGRAA